MNLKWTKHLKTEEEKEDFAKLLRHSTQIRTVLSKILQDEIDQITKEEGKEDYKGNWANLQAHRNGNKEAYKKILDLLDLERNT